jgi:hypothetical protein
LIISASAIVRNVIFLNSGDPWGAGDDEKCMFDGNTQDVSVMVMGFETLPHNEMEPVMEHLANIGTSRQSW